MAAYVRADIFPVDPILTDALIEYPVPEVCADICAPPVPVNATSGVIPGFLRADAMKANSTAVARGAVVPPSSFGVTSQTYTTSLYSDTQHVAKGDLEEARRRGSSTAVFDLLVAAGAISKTQFMRGKDVVFAAAAFVTGVWGTETDLSADPTTQWNDHSASRPLTDIETAKNTILNAVGLMPNAILMPQGVWKAIATNPALTGIDQAGRRKTLSPAEFGAMVDIEHVHIARTPKLTSNEGQTVTTSAIFGQHCLVYYRSPAGISGPQAVAQLEYRPIQSRQYEVENTAGGGSVAVNTETEYGFKITESKAGYMILNAAA